MQTSFRSLGAVALSGLVLAGCGVHEACSSPRLRTMLMRNVLILMVVNDYTALLQDFYADFDRERAENMCASLGIPQNEKIKSLSKGTKEKVQLILVMCRKARVYLLDEPIAGVDPAARDYILDTILTNYNPEGTVIISTHLISDIEKILDEVILIREGTILSHAEVDDMREESGKSIDEMFRDMFHADVYEGGKENVF